ncbi:helix-turn-helix transcriptional regulator [Ruegeria aquimaris]|uniref:Helix-turn-helix transcriptional regulator n=1 Tax=Ruegeria aquimaris TaxID=2984333 RepID=A0ABT3AK98_9RHOB|nr:helix-turn-helix transcriptional regulator [Ruegeria sp. XHP0148]MCV2889105.1 helix-turn-helix transcriptional regulator [Ruegeria sp. XHP0148]
MSKTDRHDQIVVSIYDAALDPGKWPALLSEIAQYAGAVGAMIFEVETPQDRPHLLASHFSDTYNAGLVQGYLAQHNDLEIADQAVFARHSRATDDIELIPDSVLAASEAELLARPNQRTMMQYGIRYRCGALLNKDQLFHDRFSMQFGSDAAEDLPLRLARASRLLPHIAKALSIGRPIQAVQKRHRTVLNALDKLDVGFCVLDSRMNVIVDNEEFRRQADEAGVYRTTPRGQLSFRSESDLGRARALMDGVAGHGRFGARPRKEAVEADHKGQPAATEALCIDISPLNRAGEMGNGPIDGYLLMSTDTSRSYRLEMPCLAALFDLSEAESAVLELMAEGKTNKQIAEERGRSLDTVNTQVKSILSKSNCENRTQAIRMATNISSGFLVRD